MDKDIINLKKDYAKLLENIGGNKDEGKNNSINESIDILIDNVNTIINKLDFHS